MIPTIKLNFPREVVSVHQVEMTSLCNLRCPYCPSRDIVAGKYSNRPAQHMTEGVYKRALEWVKHYVKLGAQTELNLAGIGESTMHPQFVDFMLMGREAIGPHGTLTLTTNGLICDEATVKALVPARPRVFVSLHRPEKAGLAVELYKKHGLLGGISVDPSVSANDWAGQVEWFNSGDKLACGWLRIGRVMVLADGRISMCCLDAQGIGVVGHVDQEIGSVRVKPYGLCKTCYQVIGVEGYEQGRG